MLNKSILDEEKTNLALKSILNLTIFNEFKVKDAIKAGTINKEKYDHYCDYYTMIVQLRHSALVVSLKGKTRELTDSKTMSPQYMCQDQLGRIFFAE